MSTNGNSLWNNAADQTVQETSRYPIRHKIPEIVEEVADFYELPVAPGQQDGLRDLWSVIQKSWRLIATIALSAVSVAAIMVFLMKPQYTAASTILIERQTPQVLDIRELVSEQPGSDEHDYYQTQYKILRSRSLAERVIDELNLRDDPMFNAAERPDLFHSVRSALSTWTGVPFDRASADDSPATQAAIKDEYLRHLTVKPDQGTRLVTVAFRTPYPALSARIANAHVRAYIEQGMELHAQASENAKKFLGKKLIELKDKVEKSEAALNDYRRERGMVVTTGEDKNKVVLERLTDLNKALTETSTERIALEAQAKLIRRGNYDTLPAVANNPLIQNLKEEESKCEAEYASLANQFTDEYPPVAQSKAKLERTQERLQQEMERVASSTRAAYRAAVTREVQLRKELDSEKKRVLALNDATLQDTILSREVDASRELYQNVLGRMNQMGVSAEVRASNVTIVDPAEQPTKPSSPQIGMTLGLTAFAFTLMGVALAFIVDRLDNSFKNPQEVEKQLQVASLGVVPNFNAARLAGYRPNGYRPRALPAGNGNEAARGSKEIVVSRDPFSGASEAYRSIRTSILYSRAGKPPKVILITSANEREGKTVTAVNTAAALAQTSGNVVLIDGDLRRPRIHEILGIDNLLGITEALTGHRELKDVISSTSIDRLDCITAGTIPPNPSEILGSQTMHEILEQLAKIYDFVIIDSSPVMPVTDSVVLSRIVDGSVIVVGARTPRQWVKNVCGRLRQVNANILGVVVNGLDPGKEASGYYRQTYHTYQSYTALRFGQNRHTATE